MGHLTRSYASVNPCRWSPALAAGLLIIAGAFKLWQIVTEPDPHLGTMPVSAWLLSALVGIELTLAWWLCVLRAHRWILSAAALLFAVFAAWTGYQAVHGELSCGCFGPMPIPPVVMLVVDTVVAAGLWTCVRTSTTDGVRPWHWTGMVIILVGVACAVMWGRPPFPDQRGEAPINSVPAPGWRYRVGMSVGVADPRLSRGTWRVICYRYACPHCQAHLATWAYAAREAAAAGEQWAFLWLDDPSISTDLLSDRMAGTLPRWQRTMPMMRTPALLTVADGVVTAVTESMPEASLK
jgi:hypothetical protein